MITRACVDMAVKEQAIRDIWGEEFTELLIFNSQKIAEVELAYLKIKGITQDEETLKKQGKIFIDSEELKELMLF